MAFLPNSNDNGGDYGSALSVNNKLRDYFNEEHASHRGMESSRIGGSRQEKPVYLLEHLATFTVNKESGIIYPADGMRRLLQLEKTTGIWSQKMEICLDNEWVLIMDYETKNIIERFPATLIQEPTAFTSADAMELYNNILVFIVSSGEDRSEMHIFQSQSVSAAHLVEDLKSLRAGKMVTQQRENIQTDISNNFQLATSQNHTGSFGNYHHAHNSHKVSNTEQYDPRNDSAPIRHLASGGNGETDSDYGNNDETSSVASDKYERDVTVLNHCFDDIEKFIARLQHAAAATRELDRRRRSRKTKKKDPGEGLLTLRTRPPQEKEFIDIFAKFKLSFNLLAKLKAHIHDPNAPELVHFLFTPLALIVEASSDTYFESQLPPRVVNPLLTREAINLLINCVTSKETELWRSLGDAWIVPRDQWKDIVGSYHPVFLDGWSPDYLVIDELEVPQPISSTNRRNIDIQDHHESLREIKGAGEGLIPLDNISNLVHNEITEKFGYSANDRSDFGNRSEVSVDSVDRSGHLGHRIKIGDKDTAAATSSNLMQSITTGMQNIKTREGKHGGLKADSTNQKLAHPVEDDSILESWLEDLQTAGAKVVLVTYPRTANNDKELSVARGEYLEILDDTRKWWKARNIHGQVAHVPHTIVTQYNYSEVDTGDQFYEQQQQHDNKFKHSSKYQDGDHTEQRLNENTYWSRNNHLGKKGEFRYF